MISDAPKNRSRGGAVKKSNAERSADKPIQKLSDLSKIQLLGVCGAGTTVGNISFVVDGYSSDEVGKMDQSWLPY